MGKRLMAKSDYGKSAKEGWSRKYELAWLKLYGRKCPICKGNGMLPGGQCDDMCWKCCGLGYIEKQKDEV